MQDADDYLLSVPLKQAPFMAEKNHSHFFADAQFLFPINSESIILDISGARGDFIIALAQYAKMVYALDQTWESLRVLKKEINHTSLDNIFPIEATMFNLPFPENYFDFIVLNSQTVHYQKMQELHRVIKPGGGIFVTMKNRLGWRYFYRKLHSLILQTGFQINQSYAAYFDHERTAQLIPFDLVNKLSLTIKSEHESQLSTFSRLRKWLPSGIAILAVKDRASLPSRLMQVLINQKLIAEADQNQYRLILMNNHFGIDEMINYLVYDEIRQQTIYFCRISHQKTDDALIMESTQLSRINDRLKTSELANSIPTVLFYGFVDGITIQITSYLSAKPAFTKPWKKLTSIGHSSWLQRSAPKMLAAIDWLVQFQRQTFITNISMGDVINGWLRQKALILEQKSFPVKEKLERLSKEMFLYHEHTIPLVIQHGTFHLENILRLSKTKKIFIDHFQAAEVNALPFFDLGSLIFNPLLAEWKLAGTNLSLSAYAAATGWQAYLQQWIAYYSDRLGLDNRLMQWLPQLVTIEQQAKSHPINNNVYDYPMYGLESFKAMMAWQI